MLSCTVITITSSNATNVNSSTTPTATLRIKGIANLTSIRRLRSQLVAEVILSCSFSISLLSFLSLSITFVITLEVSNYSFAAAWQLRALGWCELGLKIQWLTTGLHEVNVQGIASGLHIIKTQWTCTGIAQVVNQWCTTGRFVWSKIHKRTDKNKNKKEQVGKEEFNKDCSQKPKSVKNTTACQGHQKSEKTQKDKIQTDKIRKDNREGKIYKNSTRSSQSNLAWLGWLWFGLAGRGLFPVSCSAQNTSDYYVRPTRDRPCGPHGKNT